MMAPFTDPNRFDITFLSVLTHTVNTLLKPLPNVPSLGNDLLGWIYGRLAVGRSLKAPVLIEVLHLPDGPQRQQGSQVRQRSSSCPLSFSVGSWSSSR